MESKNNWGGKREGQGRPKGSVNSVKRTDTRNLQIYARVTESEKNLIQEKAKEAGLSLSQYVLKRLLDD